MTKRNLLLAATCLLSVCVLYAFSYPEIARTQLLTIFFPEKNLPVAIDRFADVTAEPAPAPEPEVAAPDTLPPLQERYDDFLQTGGSNPIDLKDPKAIDQQVEYDPATGMYIITEKIGDDFYRAPTYMTFEEYVRWRDQKQQNEYFDRLQGVVSSDKKSSNGVVDPIAKFDIKNSLIDRLFGGTDVSIKPQGNINLTFGFDYQKIQNPILTLRQQRNGNFDFDMDINMNASGKIGEKLNLNFNYNTQATFDFDNQMKLNYDTKGFSEDEIFQKIEAGNVSMPLRSQLIKGAQNLFGIKTELKFGHLRTTLVASQQRSKQQSLTVQGGSQVQTFEKPIDEYDENRHFFLSHWNRDEFEPAMKCLPVPMSLFNVTRMEVWITNDKLATEQFRDIVAVTDLGEADTAKMVSDQYALAAPPYLDIKGKALPDNNNNSLYAQLTEGLNDDPTGRYNDKVTRRLSNELGLTQIRDFEKMSGRLLSPSEYTYNEQLGFLSINLNVQPDQVIGVAVEYTYNGTPHKIGEFSSDVPRTSSQDTLNTNVLFVKMLKSTTANIQYPIWDLMMKNVYAVGTANVDPNEFRFDIYYEDPGKGQKRFLGGEGNADIPASIRSKPLLQLFRLDTLNLQGDPGPDGIFDFVPGLTINLRSGRIMFPVLEPFGSYLEKKLTDAGATQAVANKYVYRQLYDLTPFLAREFQQYNRFVLKGSYKSSTSSEISLGTFNLPQGSVRVTAGGQLLREGVDYQIDYNIGKVRILNDAILQSGQNVNVSFEDNTLFGFQSRTMLGARFDYELSKDVNIGATYMNLFERPLTQKVNFGDDPINNKMYGLDVSISKDAPWLTKLVDKIPFIDTKEPSSITAQAEVAALQPGHNKAINQGGDKGGTVYLDDFEGSTANLPLSNPANSWVIASVPQGDLTEFPEGNDTTLALGANRAGLSWYIADPSARDQVDGTNPYTTQIQYQDIFPNRQLTPLEQSALRPLDVTVYPRERGPYNFDVPGGYMGKSAGLTTSGQLDQPGTRWAGFMRGLNTNDFEAANIEFVEFWVLNPYMEKNDNTNISDDGSMFIDLGTISEDIMRDSRQFFENTLPTGPGTGATAPTPWGRVPVQTPVVNAFDNDPAKRELQDLGLDGLNNDGERQYFADYVNAIMASSLSPNAKQDIMDDVSNDDFVYFRDSRFEGVNPGLLARYRRFNNQQGNSPVNNTSNLNPSATNLPDMEDLDRNNSLNENESYYRYKIKFKSRDQQIPVTMESYRGLDLDDPQMQELVTDTVIFRRNGQHYVWYRFKLPLDYSQRQQVGGIQDLRSVRFVRMLWKGFTEQTTFRFATLELGRNQWRRFKQALPQIDVPSGTVCDVGFSPIPFDINSVSIEENSARTPFNYTIPFGIQREQSVGAFPDILQNEQSLSMSVCSLGYCDARAVFKSLNLDLRQYESLKMFVHAEQQDEVNFPFDSSDLTIFMRLGSDYVNNYYEYEVPLYPSQRANIVNASPDSRQYKDEVWRPENSFNFPLDLLTEVKKQRNASGTTDPIFVIPDPNNPRNKVKVVGNPNLGYVKGVMVGVRNVDPDKQQHCVEVWLNELRLNGFNERGGYAGLARVDMKLADFGNVSLAGNYTSIGWGSLEQKLIQRQREEVIQVDVSTNLELGKFLPEKSGLKVPFYAQYSNITRNPEYDPYDLDIKLKDKIRDEADPAKKEEIRTLAQDVTTIKGFNFTNVRKERKGGARKIPLPWNVENFSLTYAFNQQKRRTPFLVNDEQNRYKGALDWQYATGLKPITPFKKLIKNDKYLKFISEFNLNPIPNTYGFNSNMERLAGVTTYRFAGEEASLNTYYNRRFTWDRNYDLGWDISKSLRFNFDATARSLIDEPLEYNGDGSVVSKQQRRDSIFTNILKLGRPKNYNHTASLNWTLPFKQIPMMDWVSMKATYTAGYTWTAQSLKLQYLDADYADIVNSRSLGNVIQNNNTRQINGDLNFEGLYNKSKYLQKINKPAKKTSSKDKKTSDDSTGGLNPDEEGGGGKTAKNNNKKSGGKNDPKGRNTPDSKDLSDKSAESVRPAEGADGKTAGAPDKAGDKNSKDKNAKESKDGGDSKAKNKDRQPSIAERIALRPLMLIRKGRFTYSENFNTVVPGFTPDTKLMGLSEGFAAPGWAFVAGVQPGTDWLDKAAEKGWITQRPELNQQVMRNYTQNFDAGLTVEPFQDFRIELTANKQYSRNSTELFKDQNFLLDPNEVQFEHRAQRDLGSYTVSYFAMNTLFDKNLNGVFNRYEEYRKVISQRLGTDIGVLDPHETDEGYVKGFGKIQQQVLIPAFIAAYSDANPQTVGLNIFKTRPAINWKLNYNGLSKVGNLDKIFSSVQISHGYKSTLTVNSYNTDIFYDPTNPYTIDPLNSNYVARFEIPQVVITEQLQPMLGIDVKLKNDMTFKTDLKKSRTLAMSFIDYRLAETQSESYTVGFGYRIKDVNIPFLTGKKAKKSSSKSKSKKKPAPKPDASPTRPAPAAGGSQPNDVNIKFDFEVRDDITINHQLDQLVEAIPTRGARTISINPSVEYALNRRLKLRLFTDYRKTVPKTSQSFPITTLSSGVTVQFQLN